MSQALQYANSLGSDGGCYDSNANHHPLDNSSYHNHAEKVMNNLLECVCGCDVEEGTRKLWEMGDGEHDSDDAEWVLMNVDLVAGRLSGGGDGGAVVSGPDENGCKSEIGDSSEDSDSDASDSDKNDDGSDDDIGDDADDVENNDGNASVLGNNFGGANSIARFVDLSENAQETSESDTDDECSAGEQAKGSVGFAKPKSIPYPKHCAMCRTVGVKYTCPGCERRFCGAKCSEGHKTTYFCSGVRDPTKMRSISSFTELDYLNDLKFMEAAVRFKRDSSRKLVELNKGPELDPKERKQKHGLMHAANRNKIRFISLPKSFERHRRNNSFFEQFADTIFWTVQWKFIDVQGLTIIQERIPDTVSVGTLLKNVVHPRIPADRDPALAKLMAEGLERYSVLMAAEQTGWFQKKSYYLMSASASLRENLREAIVVEHPCFLVVHQKDLEDYLIVTQEVKKSRLKKLLWEKQSQDELPVECLSYEALVDKVCNFDFKSVREQRMQSNSEAYRERKENFKKKRMEEKNKRKEEKELKKKLKEEKKQAYAQKRRDKNRPNFPINASSLQPDWNRNVNGNDQNTRKGYNSNYNSRTDCSIRSLGPMFDSSVFHGGEIRPSINSRSMGQFVPLHTRNVGVGGGFGMALNTRPPPTTLFQNNSAQSARFPSNSVHFPGQNPVGPNNLGGLRPVLPDGPGVTGLLPPQCLNTSFPPPNFLPPQLPNPLTIAPVGQSVAAFQPNLGSPLSSNFLNSSVPFINPSGRGCGGSGQTRPPLLEDSDERNDNQMDGNAMYPGESPRKDDYLQKYGTPRLEGENATTQPIYSGFPSQENAIAAGGNTAPGCANCYQHKVPTSVQYSQPVNFHTPTCGTDFVRVTSGNSQIPYYPALPPQNGRCEVWTIPPPSPSFGPFNGPCPQHPITANQSLPSPNLGIPPPPLAHHQRQDFGPGVGIGKPPPPMIPFNGSFNSPGIGFIDKFSGAAHSSLGTNYSNHMPPSAGNDYSGHQYGNQNVWNGGTPATFGNNLGGFQNSGMPLETRSAQSSFSGPPAWNHNVTSGRHSGGLSKSSLGNYPQYGQQRGLQSSGDVPPTSLTPNFSPLSDRVADTRVVANSQNYIKHRQRSDNIASKESLPSFWYSDNSFSSSPTNLTGDADQRSIPYTPPSSVHSDTGSNGFGEKNGNGRTANNSYQSNANNRLLQPGGKNPKRAHLQVAGHDERTNKRAAKKFKRQKKNDKSAGNRTEQSVAETNTMITNGTVSKESVAKQSDKSVEQPVVVVKKEFPIVANSVAVDGVKVEKKIDFFNLTGYSDSSDGEDE